MSSNKRDLFPPLRGQEELDEESFRGRVPPGGCIAIIGLVWTAGLLGFAIAAFFK